MSKIIKSTFVFVVLACLTGTAFSQTNKKLEQMGDQSMEKGKYASAVYFYSQVMNKLIGNPDLYYNAYEVKAFYKQPKKTDSIQGFEPPKNPNEDQKLLIHKLGMAYSMAKDYKATEVWMKAATENPIPEFPHAKFFYGDALLKNEKIDEAEKELNEYIESARKEDNKYYQLAQDRIISCNFIRNPNSKFQQIQVEEADSALKIGSANYAVMYHGDKLVFASARFDSVIDKKMLKELGTTSMYNSDLYMVEENEDGYSKPQKFSEVINLPNINEGAGMLSKDGKSFYFTRMNPENRRETAIYVSRKMNNAWLEPMKLGKNVNREGSKSMSPYISDDNTTLYFASDRPGGQGGMDIWVTKIDGNGKASPPENLGFNVNTSADEISPFYHSPSKTLYFASEGHIGFGGLDIFQTKIDNNTDWWAKATNLGNSVNSPRDDSFFVLSADEKSGYITSDRDKCEDCDSVYNMNISCNKIYKLKKPEILVTISGYVYDDETDEIIAGAKVTINDVDGVEDPIVLMTDEKGYYKSSLVLNKEYFMNARKKGYFRDAGIENTLDLTRTTALVRDFRLKKIPEGEIEIKGIEYDFDSANLRDKSKVELDKLIEFLNLNSDISVEIRSHTDFRGNDDYNMRLSAARAKSCVDYLIEKGIDRNRLVPKGFGETTPAEVKTESGQQVTLTPEYIKSLPTEEQQEEAHQRNRRTAFKVLSQTD